MAKTRFSLHPACKLFPKLGQQELHELADDIKANGLQNPIVLIDGKILDGRNRHAACKIAKVKPRFEQWNGSGSPVEWVISQNLMRRHLTASQRAVIALDILPLLEKEAKVRQKLSRGRGKKGRNKFRTFSQNGEATEIAARFTRSNSRYVKLVKSIKESAPELVAKIRSGELNVLEAMRMTGNEVNDPTELEGEDGKRPAKNHWQQKRNGAGDPLILHPTPPHVTEALLVREQFKGSILEPACGDGSMADVLRDHGYKVRATDINNGHDFMVRRSKAANIVTNPPYGQSMAEAFVRHAMKLAENKIAVLVPFYFLEGVQRYSLFSDPNWPVKAVYIFSRRPTFGDHDDPAPFGSIWVVWDRSQEGSPKIEWILETEPEGV